MAKKHINYKYYDLRGYKVRVEFTKYFYNKALAVVLTTDKEEPFATLSVNLEASDFIDKKSAYIDTNNCSWAEKFLQENNIAEFTGMYGQIGFCTYPLYNFSKYIKEKGNERHN